MKKRILLLSTIITTIALFTGVSILVATDVPEDMKIKSGAYEKHKKGPVPFSHKKHIDKKVGCKDCHHMLKEGETVQKCSACHDASESKGKVKKLMLAYHKTCKNCHMDLKKAGKDTGPVKCNDCHEKE
jgi:hypothetical protein